MSPADSPFAQLPAPGPHPATAELRAYAAGTLAPTEEHRIEAHTLDCERCADLVEGFAMSDAATTDQAVAELRTRLQARIGAEEPAPVVGGWAWPRITAAAALLGVVVGGIWGWEQHETTTTPTTARLETTAPAAPPAAEAPAVAAVQEPAPEQELAANTSSTETTKSSASSADYAAVAAAQSARPAPLRQRQAQAADASADGLVLADQETSAPPVAAAPTAAAPAEAPAASEAAFSAPARKGARSAEIAAADTVAYDKTSVMARQETKAKAASSSPMAASSGAAARVLTTPMPAAAAINPAPVGGTSAFRDYVRREALKFEPDEHARPLSGSVRLKFMVGADGKVSDLKITRGMREDYDSEAIRMVCDGPAWQPGIAGGRRAALPMEISIPF